MKFEDIYDKKEKEKCKQLSYDDVKPESNENVYYKDINLGTPREIKKMIDVSFKVLNELKKYQKKFGENLKCLKI